MAAAVGDLTVAFTNLTAELQRWRERGTEDRIDARANAILDYVAHAIGRYLWSLFFR